MGKFDCVSALESRCFLRICSSTEQVAGIDVVPGRIAADGGWQSIFSDMALQPEERVCLQEWLLVEFEKSLSILAQHPLRPSLISRRFFISLPISVTLLDADEWVAKLLQLIRKSAASGFGTELEVQDWGNADGQASAEWSFEAIRDNGAQLALSGFPSTAKSFASLARHRFDRVKINHSLIPSMYDSIATWTRQRELIKGLVSVIGGLGSETVLAGIEREVQLRFFKELAVAQWQGLYWGGAAEFATMLDRSKNLQRVP